ncbi:hypothetical protein K4F52_009589 [Lecanicillium sp. MT-2017a]|nr:hypothetical protein K4F52_009589 [Lecanicillium sp. MT-2017a]
MLSDKTLPRDFDASNHAARIVIVVFIGIALYNFLELQCYIIGAFKRYSGLYFWSFMVASWGIAFNATGYLIRHLHAGPGILHATIILIGWSTMITGQSLVLYSRLHIILPDPSRLRYVLAMIIVDAIWLGVPIIVLVYGVNSKNPEPFEKPYAIFEKLQLTAFFLQELIISGIYIFETAKLLKFQAGVGNLGTHRVMNHLIAVNIFVVLLDISIIVLEFTEHYNLQTAWKPLVYSVKLKAEFSVLNRLVEFSQQLRVAGSLNPVNYAVSADVALERYLRNAAREDESIHNNSEIGADAEGQRRWGRIRKLKSAIVGRANETVDDRDQSRGRTPEATERGYARDGGSAAASYNSTSPFVRRGSSGQRHARR